jgi:hypothetical protein
MNDDDFTGIVRSGSQHSVSVSEHTGNAKTPKNIVASHEEETEARKRAFEQKTLAELEAQKALAAALAEHTEHIASDDGGDEANIQKIAADKAAQNRQAIPEAGTAAPNVQSVSTDVIDANIQNVGTDNIQANIQNIGTDKGIQDNRQGVPTDVIAPNRQNVGSGNIAANNQNINGEKAIEANRQGIPTDAIAPNRQNVGGGNIAANNQSIDGEKAIEANRQNIPTNVIAANVQEVAIDGIAANNQTLGTSSFSANNQALEQDAVGVNRQGIDNGPVAAPNLQGLPADESINNRQTLPDDANANNRQSIPGNASPSNEQGIAKLAIQDNKQPLPQENLAANHQTLETPAGIGPNNQAIAAEAAILNRQAAPEDAPPGINRQGVDNGKIESHFEQLPSETVERKKVDFPTGGGTSGAAPSTASATQASTVKPKVAPASARRAPVTEAEKQQAKLKREQINDAFHGRLAGIKHNVEALNSRLTDFEEKVHKEDATLDKGNPDDFEVNLD